MTASFPIETLLALLLGSVRAAAWLMICPPFAGKGIPAIVKVLLSVGIALSVLPRLAAQIPSSFSTPELMVGIVEQAMVGVALGFITALLFAAVQAAGSLIDLFGGFSVAFAFDPLSLTGNAIFGRFYNLLASTLLFVTDGHQMVLRGFTRSYQAIPLSGNLSIEALQKILTDGLGQMFLAALQIAGPIIAVLFLADIGLGLLSRVAPALNVFGLGFPAKILLTLAIVGTAMLIVPSSVATLVDRSVTAVLTVLGA